MLALTARMHGGRGGRRAGADRAAPDAGAGAAARAGALLASVTPLGLVVFTARRSAPARLGAARRHPGLACWRGHRVGAAAPPRAVSTAAGAPRVRAVLGASSPARVTQARLTGGAIVDLALRLTGGARGRLRVRLGRRARSPAAACR